MRSIRVNPRGLPRFGGIYRLFAFLLGIRILGTIAVTLIPVSAEDKPVNAAVEWSVQLRRVVVRTEQLKPPQEENVFDLEIANNSKKDLWFVWTDRMRQVAPNKYFRYRSTSEGGYVNHDGIDCKKLNGRGILNTISFMGEDADDRFHAMLLTPGAKVTCKQYPSSLGEDWTSLPFLSPRHR